MSLTSSAQRRMLCAFQVIEWKARNDFIQATSLSPMFVCFFHRCFFVVVEFENKSIFYDYFQIFLSSIDVVGLFFGFNDWHGGPRSEVCLSVPVSHHPFMVSSIRWCPTTYWWELLMAVLLLLMAIDDKYPFFPTRTGECTPFGL